MRRRNSVLCAVAAVVLGYTQYSNAHGQKEEELHQSARLLGYGTLNFPEWFFWAFPRQLTWRIFLNFGKMRAINWLTERSNLGTMFYTEIRFLGDCEDCTRRCKSGPGAKWALVQRMSRERHRTITSYLGCWCRVFSSEFCKQIFAQRIFSQVQWAETTQRYSDEIISDTVLKACVLILALCFPIWKDHLAGFEVGCSRGCCKWVLLSRLDFLTKEGNCTPSLKDNSTC